jgi:hypothetical protein
MSSKKKVLAWVLGLGFASIVAGVSLLIQPVCLPLKVTILGWFDMPWGTREVYLRVQNNIRRDQHYTYRAEFQTATGWAEARNWEPPLGMNWIKSYATNYFTVPPPEGVTAWRLKFMRYPEPTPLGRKWYSVVWRTGLKRVGLRDAPSRSYFFTEKIVK